MIRNIDERVGYHIGIAAHMIQNSFNQKLAQYDLTVAQAKVLFLLVQYGDQLQSELQNRLFIKASTMNGIIDSLLKKQLLNKCDSETDRRSKLISLTEKGKKLEETLWKDTHQLDESLLQGISQKEKQLLLKTIKTIITNLQD